MTSGSLSSDQAEEIIREQLEMEEKLARDLARQREMQLSLMKSRLAQRKKEQMRKLKEQQQIDKAKVSCDALPCDTTCPLNALTLFTLSLLTAPSPKLTNFPKLPTG